MKNYEKKLVKEMAKLDKKVAKLEAFISSGVYKNIISYEEQDNIKRQLRFMKQYSSVLKERIDSAIPENERLKEDVGEDG